MSPPPPALRPTGYASGPAKRCPACGERFPFDYRVCPRDVVELEIEPDDDRDPYLGTTLADTYRIARRIGVGGMGAVYEAMHTRLSARRFAIKIMHQELARKAELVARFRREAEVAGLAAHPNSVTVFDVDDTPQGIPFIVAELLQGEDLGQLLDRVGRISLPDTVHIVRQLCAALSAAHAVGVVHRDMKPDNVFLVAGMPPVVKLLDFGIARVTDAGVGARTRTGVVMGTPAYMSPEQARGEHVDHRCDVYAVGAILYRCLTGRSIYPDDDDPAATLTAVLTREPERPRAVAPDLPEAVELVIERAIARQPHDRFQSMEQLDDALATLVGPSELAMRGSQTALRSPTIATESPLVTGRAVARARPMIAIMSVLCFVLGLGMIVDVIADLLAARSESGQLTRTEGALVLLGVIAAVATPTALWIRFLRARVWRNSMRAVALARRATTVVAATATTYAFVTLVLRSIDVGLATSSSTATGLYGSAIATAAALLAALVAVLTTRPDRPREVSVHDLRNA